MRLLDSETLQLRLFNESDLPDYVILSHTWSDEEVTFEELQVSLGLATPRWRQWLFERTRQSSTNFERECWLSRKPNPFKSHAGVRRGFSKIVNTANIARQLGYRYFWIDTVCIDKKSSAELQEAINSMYRWYQRSSMCLIYLEDAEPVTPEDRDYQYIEYAVSNSRWVTRGWTLQELIAPRFAKLYDAEWNLICAKDEAFLPLSLATGVPTDVLATGEFDHYCVAQRMSWAAHRLTTRVEDLAYCLMGLFDIHMPMLYGEGEGAFIRLQENIIQKFADDSLLAWQALEDDSVIYRGLLARSPREFAGASEISKRRASVMSTSGLGIGLHVEVQPYKDSEHHFVALLQTTSQDRRIALLLRKLEQEEPQYARVSSQALLLRDHEVDGPKTAIHVHQKLSIPPDFVTGGVHSFRLQLHPASKQSHELRVYQAWPNQSWNPTLQEMIIPRASSTFDCLIWLTQADSSSQSEANIVYKKHSDSSRCICQGLCLLLRFNRLWGSGRCNIVHAPAGPTERFSAKNWHWLLDTCAYDVPRRIEIRNFPSCLRHKDDFLSVSLKTILRDDKTSFLVDARVFSSSGDSRLSQE